MLDTALMFAMTLASTMTVAVLTWRRATAVERKISVDAMARVTSEMKLAATAAFADGRRHALEEIADDETNPFRGRARSLLGRCPNCNRSCIHCARNNERARLQRLAGL
jgi:hypothetical protein